MVTDTENQVQSLEALDEDRELQTRLVRKALKAKFQGRVTYWQGDYIQGVAMAKNLGSGDVGLKLNRCLAPGDAIRLDLDCLTYRGLPIVMEGEVIECDASRDESGFAAVVHIRRRASAV